MNAKWCVSTLIIILVLLGLSQPHKKASNQQISLEFTDVEIASESAREEALSTITKRLLFLGVEVVEIIDNDGNHLNIRYYSDIDAKDVKEFLSNDNPLTFEYDDEVPSDFPKEKFPENYSLVVTDLHQQANNGLNITGNLIPTQKEYQIGFSSPVILRYDYPLVLRPNDNEKIALRIYKNIAIAIDNTSQSIP
ncbi:hypothetical protein NYZ99_04480 [Maribacter litopenaei]|uniref:Uncharacterized protein n=1 Tax=Maribacter litopenaei TaxID=2976127 RepID=A0ABY5YC52_9FLAO|nr:hypothetical protein [Maribacter litopenaei]UWX55700.1 hypothetical protein NYZ99_04480 [Maribacter litopenaei]